MSAFVDKTIVAELRAAGPVQGEIIFARSVEFKHTPIVWVFVAGGVAMIALTLLAMFGVIGGAFGEAIRGAWVMILAVCILWVTLAAWSMNQKPSVKVAITSESTIIGLFPELRQGTIEAIELKSPVELNVRWRMAAKSPTHFALQGYPLKIEDEAAADIASFLAEKTGLPVG